MAARNTPKFGEPSDGMGDLGVIGSEIQINFSVPMIRGLGHTTRMDNTEIRIGRFGWRLVAAALAPFIVASIYLFLTRWPSYRFTTTAFSDYAGLGLSVLIGAAFIATLPIRASYRVLSVLFYLPVIVALLFYFTFWFIAVVFHDGL